MNCESAEASQIKLVYPTIKMLFDNTFLKEDAEEGWVLTEVSLIIILWLYSTRL